MQAHPLAKIDISYPAGVFFTCMLAGRTGTFLDVPPPLERSKAEADGKYVLRTNQATRQYQPVFEFWSLVSQVLDDLCCFSPHGSPVPRNLTGYFQLKRTVHAQKRDKDTSLEAGRRTGLQRQEAREDVIQGFGPLALEHEVGQMRRAEVCVRLLQHRDKGGAIALEPEEGEETPVTEPPHTGVLSRDKQLQLLAKCHCSRPRQHNGRSPICDWGLGLESRTVADLGLGISSNRSTFPRARLKRTPLIKLQACSS